MNRPVLALLALQLLPRRVAREPIFSLRSDGGEVLDWRRAGSAEGVIRFHSASAGLDARVEITPRAGGAAFECRLFLANRRRKPSALLDRIHFFRLRWGISPRDVPVVHHCGGGFADATFPSEAWRVRRTELPDWTALTLSGTGGRSSNRDLPLFLVTDLREREGLAFAIGYSGNVRSTILRDRDQRSVLVTAAPGNLQLRIPPREEVQVGSALALAYRGDATDGKNALRRVLREEICPPLPSRSGLPAVAYDHWFGIEQGFDEKSLLREAREQAACGAEYFTLDAAWAKQGTHLHYGAGNWEFPDQRKFPRGLPAFAEEVRKLGLRFGTWLEPETVEAGTALERQLGSSLLRLPNGWRHLADFSEPTVVDRLTRITCRLVEDCGVEWIRMDSNLDPEPFWARIPDPGARGWKELKHFEGFYRYLDTLRARFPRLHLEGCSSGGRRIDLETLKRSHSLWISDITAFAHAVHHHVAGANHFLPSHLLNTEVVKWNTFPRDVKPYKACTDADFSDFWMLSLFGGMFGTGGPQSRYPVAIQRKFHRFIAEYLRVRENLLGDFYPLLPQPSRGEDWDAWQFHNPATGGGMVLVFRPRGGPTRRRIPLRALDPRQRYEVRTFPHPSTARADGRSLLRRGLLARLDTPSAGRLFAYRPVSAPKGR